MKKHIILLLLIPFQSCITAPLVLTTKSDTTKTLVPLGTVETFTNVKGLPIETGATGVLNAVQDTIPCFMLCSDTSFTLDTLRRVPRIITERIYTSKETFWVHGYEVREKHNTSEGVVDAGINQCVENGKIVPCYYDYYIHKEYLDYNKHPLKKEIVVWQAK